MIVHKLKKFISSFLIETELRGPFIKDLTGNVVVITGGTGKIGMAVSRVLTKKGAKVIAIANKVDNNDRHKIETVKANVTNKSEIKKAIQKIIKKYEKIDVLINCAGLFSQKPIELTSEKEYDRVMDTNVKGIFLSSNVTIPYMKKLKKGLIINIGSKISHNTNVEPNKVLYATSKYAVEGFSIALAKELKEYGIRVTCLMLGTVNTFVSLRSKKFLNPERIGFVIATIIASEDIEFESIIIKSTRQNL